jgi:hypothetical protein
LKKEWSNFAIGKYKATLVLTYGGDNQLVTQEREFYVLPWRLMTIFGVGGAFLLLILFGVLRGYNRMIISQHEKKQKGMK